MLSIWATAMVSLAISPHSKITDDNVECKLIHEYWSLLAIDSVKSVSGCVFNDDKLSLVKLMVMC